MSTPDQNEAREALERLLRDLPDPCVRADAILAAGFRRSPVPADTPPEDVAAQAIRDAADAWHAEHKGTKPLVYSWLWNYAAALAAVPADGETEWEYGLLSPDACENGMGGAHLVSNNREHIQKQQRRGHPSIKAVQRRKAGPWLPIPEGSAD